MERTLAIIKPDAAKKRIIGKIVSRIEEEGFTIVRMKLVHLTKDEAKGFYAVHGSDARGTAEWEIAYFFKK